MFGDYDVLYKAYSFFNEKLFENRLPDVVITLQRKSRSYGYFHFEAFASRTEKKKASEIAINPDGFAERSDDEILSTLAHEMAHCYECYFNEPPRKGYHTKFWAGLMEDIGLIPSANGQPGGKKSGQKMSHYIEQGGKFEKTVGGFLIQNKLEWESFLNSEESKKDKKKSTRKKYVCPTCDLNIWAKKEINVICGDCHIELKEEDDEN